MATPQFLSTVGFVFLMGCFFFSTATVWALIFYGFFFFLGFDPLVCNHSMVRIYI